MFNFDLQFIPGEAASNLDWTKIQRDFQRDFNGSPPQLTAGAECISRTAPLYPLFQSAVWELAAVQQILAAFDECHVARQQTLLLSGAARQRAQRQLQRAECELSAAKAALIQALDDLRGDDNPSFDATLHDLEAAWESHLLHPTLYPTPRPTP